MTPSPLPVPPPPRLRDLRRDPSLAPGGSHHASWVQHHLPLVHGVASRLIPEEPSAGGDVSVAVFEAFAARYRRLPKSTVVVRWLWRTTWYAAIRERQRRRLPLRAAGIDAVLAESLVRRLARLKPRLQDALLLRLGLGGALTDVARGLKTSERRAGKWQERGLARLNRDLRKAAARWRRSPEASVPGIGVPFGAGIGQSEAAIDASALLGSLAGPVPTEVELLVVARSNEWTPKTPRSDLVEEVLRRWRWLSLGRSVRRVATGMATAFGVLLVLGVTFIYLAQHGYLTLIFLRMQQRSLVKQFPEMATPARPWPVPDAALVRPAEGPPRTSVELYGTTNIWAARLRLSPQQWKDLQPASVPPVQQRNGPMPLRNPKASRSGLAGAIGIDFRWSEGDFEFAGQTYPQVRVRYRGNGTFVNSLHGAKQSFKVDLKRPGAEATVGGVTTLNFVNSIPDFSYLKDALAQRVFRELGAVGPRTAYAYLSLDAPPAFTNQALGLYVLIENIDADFARDRFGTRAAPIFKPVTYELFADWGKEWKAYADVYDLKTKATPEQLARLVELIQLVSHASDEEFARRLPDYLDLEEYAAFLAGHVLMSSYDGYLSNGQNFYLYLDPRTNRFGFIPWDQDHGWGEFGYIGTAESRENASIWHPQAGKNRFLERALGVEAFRTVYRAKLEQGLRGGFSVTALFPAIDTIAAVVRPAVAAESAFRLERFERSVSTNWETGPRDGKMFDGTAEGPKAPVHQLKRFIQARTKSVRDQLDERSEGVRVQGFGG